MFWVTFAALSNLQLLYFPDSETIPDKVQVVSGGHLGAIYIVESGNPVFYAKFSIIGHSCSVATHNED